MESSYVNVCVFVGMCVFKSKDKEKKIFFKSLKSKQQNKSFLKLRNNLECVIFLRTTRYHSHLFLPYIFNIVFLRDFPYSESPHVLHMKFKQ